MMEVLQSSWAAALPGQGRRDGGAPPTFLGCLGARPLPGVMGRDVGRDVTSRRQNVGNLAESEGIRPNAGMGNRHMQADLAPPAGIEPATPGLGIMPQA